MWLTPPTRKNQITDFARGLWCGLPSCRTAVAPRATPSRWSMAARARPVKPSPVSARKARRVCCGSNMTGPRSADRHELVEVQDGVDQVLPGTQVWSRSRRHRAGDPGVERGQLLRVRQQGGLL